MSKLIASAVAAVIGMLSVPAQANQAMVTRAQVKAELAALQATGYRVSGEEPGYPVKLQAALSKIDGTGMAAKDRSGYGPMPATMSESAHRNDPFRRDLPVYRGR
ncbi:DUF4148 domain-containing protein [Burkholderia pyrrocinia]